MASSRRAIQEAHERFHVGLLLRRLKHNHRAEYTVLSEPNPPEAIITTGKRTSWVEVVTAFWNDAYAKDQYSYATPGERHVPVGEGVFMDMTPAFARNFTRAVQGKLSKESYLPFKDRYGPGYLVVAVQFPFFGRDAFDWIEKEWESSQFINLGCFRSIYLAVPHMNDYALIRWQPSSDA